MDAGDADSVKTAIDAKWLVILGNLISFGKIGIKIVFAVEFGK